MDKANGIHVGSDFDDYLEEEGMAAEVTATALKRVLAWQIEQAMQAGKVSKTMMAQRMGTSRAALNRLLDPTNTAVTLKTLDKAASVLGRKIRLELEEEICCLSFRMKNPIAF